MGIQNLEPVLKAVKELGLPGAILLVFFLALLWVCRYLLNKLVAQMQGEINRLADDNRAYREVYFAKVQGLSSKEVAKLQPPNDGKQSRRR